MHWADTPIHFIDFEGSRTSGILEFGVVTLRGGTITGVRTQRCAAIGRIPPEDVAVHGLHAEALAGEAPFSAEWEYFAGLRESGPLAAHFANAENSLLKSVWAYPRVAPDFAQPGRSATEWGPWIDTGRLYPQIFPQLGSNQLEQLVGTSGLQGELDAAAAQHCPADRRRYHAALYDALGGALLLLALLRRAEFGQATIPWLLQMSTLDPQKRGAMQQGGLFG
ncbi:MAG: 3'-5' exonuclease [Opitutae bacterium]|nr:3'-5' exonuclease [Opitutae bacterium]